MNNLTGRELAELGIITGEIASENIQQHGVDLNLLEVHHLTGINPGLVPKTGKTELTSRRKIEPGVDKDNKKIFTLHPGTYGVKLQQGCNVPADKLLLIRQRNSLYQNGAIIHSPIFDAGFKTDSIETVLIIHVTLRIELGARIAQIYAHNSNEVSNLYVGQWQGKKINNQ